jgi:outer membrane protein TolC
MATKLDKAFVASVRKSHQSAVGEAQNARLGFETLVGEVERLEQLEDQKEKALQDLMAAYERLVRSGCTPEQIEKKPWECWEFLQAQKAFAGQI